jgi:hypothetical protein
VPGGIYTQGTLVMHAVPLIANPFALLTDPEAIFRAVEASPRLEGLNRCGDRARVGALLRLIAPVSLTDYDVYYVNLIVVDALDVVDGLIVQLPPAAPAVSASPHAQTTARFRSG